MTPTRTEPAPLADRRFTCGTWPAARIAGRLLAALGGEVRLSDATADAVTCEGGAAVGARAASAEEDWSSSGAAGLTGRGHGPALSPRGAPASVVRAGGLVLDLLARLSGGESHHADEAHRSLGERARLVGLVRGGDISCGGAARLVRTRDGWVALNLSRPEDAELLPALTHGAVRDLDWSRITRWASGVAGRELLEQGTTLGLPVGLLGERLPSPAPFRLDRLDGYGGGPSPTPRPRSRGGLRVVNLGSLWASPLCARLVAGRPGATVIDVEGPHRPDGARSGSPAFYARLHAGNERVVLDPATAEGRRALGELLRTADVVVTGSRQSALRRMGATAEALADPAERVWVHITGHGLSSERVAFGDDAAVAGGLTARDADGPVFAGDAIADPLTGWLAAVAASACLRARGSWRVEVSLSNSAAWAAHV